MPGPWIEVGRDPEFALSQLLEPGRILEVGFYDEDMEDQGTGLICLDEGHEYLIIDRGGVEPNCEEHTLAEAVVLEAD